MIFTITIFTLAIIGAFGMLMFRAWELKTNRFVIDENNKELFTPKLSFRYFEKIILFITKHVIQWIILTSVKFWFIIITKTKILIQNKLPKINRLFQRKSSISDSRKISFIERAVIESKIKIKKVKEKIKKEHEDKIIESSTLEKEEVDKIL